MVKRLEKMGVRTGEQVEERRMESELRVPQEYLRRVVMMLMIQGGDGLRRDHENKSYFGVFGFIVLMVMRMMLFMPCSSRLWKSLRSMLCAAAVFSSSSEEFERESDPEKTRECRKRQEKNKIGPGGCKEANG